MPSTAFLGLPLAHYITFYFDYSFLLILSVYLLFVNVSRALINSMSNYLLNFFRSPEISLLAQLINLN